MVNSPSSNLSIYEVTFRREEDTSFFSNGVDRRGPDIGMAKKRLDRAYVVVRLKQVGRES